MSCLLSLSLARSLWNDSSRKDLIDNRNYIGDGFKRDCKCEHLERNIHRARCE